MLSHQAAHCSSMTPFLYYEMLWCAALRCAVLCSALLCAALQISVYYVGVVTCLLVGIAISKVLNFSCVSLTVARMELKFKCLKNTKYLEVNLN